MKDELDSYFRFTTRSRRDKAFNSLLGIIEGVSIDGHINVYECGFLRRWVDEHQDLEGRAPFDELLPLVSDISDGKFLSMDERDDIRYACEKNRSALYYDGAAGDMQRLHSIVGAIAVDGNVSELELRHLSVWLSDHEHLKTCWPYDEIDALVTTVMRDGRIDDAEHSIIHGFFADLLPSQDRNTIGPPVARPETLLSGVCAVCPTIEFPSSKFCFTGLSSKYTRDQLSAMVRDRGGFVTRTISQELNYLVIGADGNPCWAFACYGRKVEQAVQARKSGRRLVIVHEHDFHDAVADFPLD